MFTGVALEFQSISTKPLLSLMWFWKVTGMMSFQADLLEIPQPETTCPPPPPPPPPANSFPTCHSQHFFFFFGSFWKLFQLLKRRQGAKKEPGNSPNIMNGCFWILRGSGASLFCPLHRWRYEGLSPCSRLSGLFHSQLLKPAHLCL